MKSMMIVYMTLIGVVLGVELAAGAFMAPVIFFPHKYLGDGVLSHFQSGILMTHVFLKTNVLLSVTALGALGFEISTWVRKASHDVFATLCVVGILILTAIFVLYHTPFIIEAQQQGAHATVTEAFNAIHKQSEWVMKALMVLQISLLFRRLWLVQK